MIIFQHMCVNYLKPEQWEVKLPQISREFCALLHLPRRHCCPSGNPPNKTNKQKKNHTDLHLKTQPGWPRTRETYLLCCGNSPRYVGEKSEPENPPELLRNQGAHPQWQSLKKQGKCAGFSSSVDFLFHSAAIQQGDDNSAVWRNSMIPDGVRCPVEKGGGPRRRKKSERVCPARLLLRDLRRGSSPCGDLPLRAHGDAEEVRWQRCAPAPPLPPDFSAT